MTMPTNESVRRYKIGVAYDGTAYAGWQVQPNGVTIQEKLEAVLLKLTGEKRKIHGSGRTDQGVHARKQVAHFDLHRPFPVKSLPLAFNSLLPPDIRVISAARTNPKFDARRHATSKEYRYFIWNAEIMPPVHRLYKAHVKNPLDVTAMKEAAALLAGRHDFAAFTASSKREIETTVREIYDLTVARRGCEIVIRARGSGFLYKMVRSLAGFLIRVGEGAVPAGEARAILESRIRTAHVPTARPQGLFLWNVSYR
jgi:tRNA pseudouridine38-40 synthase